MRIFAEHAAHVEEVTCNCPTFLGMQMPDWFLTDEEKRQFTIDLIKNVLAFLIVAVILKKTLISAGVRGI